MGVHTAEEIENFGKKDLQTLSEMLGDKEFFFGSEPAMLDLVVFSQVGQLVMVDKEHACPLRDYLEADCKNLVGLVNRMKDRCWGDHWDNATGEEMDLNPHIPKVKSLFSVNYNYLLNIFPLSRYYVHQLLINLLFHPQPEPPAPEPEKEEEEKKEEAKEEKKEEEAKAESKEDEKKEDEKEKAEEKKEEKEKVNMLTKLQGAWNKLKPQPAAPAAEKAAESEPKAEAEATESKEEEKKEVSGDPSP